MDRDWPIGVTSGGPIGAVSNEDSAMTTKRRWIIEKIVIEEGAPGSLTESSLNSALRTFIGAMGQSPRVISIEGIRLIAEPGMPDSGNADPESQ
jgi:hypothetical protein